MTTKLSDPVIVCAALRHPVTGLIVSGARHFDVGMTKTIHALQDTDVAWCHAEQGFIDQHNVFYTREDAFAVAKTNNQIVKWVGGQAQQQDDGTMRLYSENLY